jgi:hypothetical protein
MKKMIVLPLLFSLYTLKLFGQYGNSWDRQIVTPFWGNIKTIAFAKGEPYRFLNLKGGLYLLHRTDSPTARVSSGLLYNLNYNTSRNGLVLLELYYNGINMTADIKYEEKTIEIISNTSAIVLYFDENNNLLSYKLKSSPEVHGFPDETVDFIYDENNRLIQIYHDDAYTGRKLRTSVYYDGLLRIYDRLPLGDGKNSAHDMDDERNFDERVIFDGDKLKYVVKMSELHWFNNPKKYHCTIFEYNGNGDLISQTNDFLNGTIEIFEIKYLEFDEQGNWIISQISFGDGTTYLRIRPNDDTVYQSSRVIEYN